jgi:hypothetical protein
MALGLTIIEDVAREFFKRRIGPLPRGETRPPDVFGWTLYAWMLEEIGRKQESEE